MAGDSQSCELVLPVPEVVAPFGHGVHDVASPAASLYEPAGHGVQLPSWPA